MCSVMLCTSGTVALRLIALTADGCLPWFNETACRGAGGILITRCLVPAGDEQGQGQPPRVSE
jgi:hypothetical protein